MTTAPWAPAFPSHGSMGEVAHEGMTLRDYFAAKAMAIVYHGYCEQGTTWPKPHCFSQIAKEAFEMADAMLKARKS